MFGSGKEASVLIDDVDDATEENVRRIRGRVKWFDPVKGFGFVVADADSPDILLHANVLRNFGQSSIADQAIVEIDSQKTDRGFQAVKVHAIEPPSGSIEDKPAFVTPMEGVDLKEIELEPARVKWFDTTKGFGFANTFASSEDVFIHIDVLRRSGLASLMPGEGVAVRVISGERGRMAVEVCGWEVASRKD